MSLLKKIYELYFKYSYGEIIGYWNQILDFHLQHLSNDANFVINYRKLYGESIPGYERLLHKYITEDLPLACFQARKFCPQKVKELEASLEEVKRQVYPLRVI